MRRADPPVVKTCCSGRAGIHGATIARAGTTRASDGMPTRQSLRGSDSHPTRPDNLVADDQDAGRIGFRRTRRWARHRRRSLLLVASFIGKAAPSYNRSGAIPFAQSPRRDCRAPRDIRYCDGSVQENRVMQDDVMMGLGPTVESEARAGVPRAGSIKIRPDAFEGMRSPAPCRSNADFITPYVAGISTGELDRLPRLYCRQRDPGPLLSGLSEVDLHLDQPCRLPRHSG